MKKHINVGLLLLIFVFIMGMHFLLTSTTPYFADDFAYRYSFDTDAASEMENSKVTDIPSLIQSQIAHYYSMNGRIVAHTLAQLFLMFPKTLFNAVNSFVFALLGLLVCFHAVGNFRSIKVIDLLIAYTALLLLAPAFGQSYLWLVGSCNYLFTFVLVLLFLIPYRMRWNQTAKSNIFLSLIAAVGMLIFGIIAGNTNENIGVSLVVVLLLYIAAFILFHRKIKIWVVTGWFGVLTGSLICLVAPGNTVRSGGNPIDFSVVSILKHTLFYSHSMIEHFALLLAGMFIMLGAILLIRSRKKELPKKVLVTWVRDHFFWCFYGVFFLGAVYAMTLPAKFPVRAWSHPLALLIIVFLMIFHKFILSLGLKAKELKSVTTVSCVVLVLLLALGYGNALPAIRAANATYQYRASLIQEAKANNQNEVALPSVISVSRYICPDHFGELSEDPDWWMNKVMARYYGIDTIYKSEDVEI